MIKKNNENNNINIYFKFQQNNDEVWKSVKESTKSKYLRSE